MYNRYIRNDHGTYTRIPEEDGIPVPPSGGEPVHGGEPVPDGELFRGGEPSPGQEPPRGRNTSHQENAPRAGNASHEENGGADAPPHGPPPRRPGGRGRGGPGGLFRRFLDDARMDRIDDGDLLLLGLLLFLAREGADEELLTALGLLLIL